MRKGFGAIVSILSIEKTVLSDHETLIVRYSIDRRVLTTSITARRVEIGEGRLDALVFPHEFREMIHHNGPIIERVHKIVRDFLTGKPIVFPKDVGRTDEIYDHSTKDF